MKRCVMWAACSLHRLLAMKRCVMWAVWGAALHYCMQFWDDPFRLCVCVWSSGQLIAFWSVVWLHHSCMCCEMSVWSHCSVNEQVGLNKKKLLSLYLTGCFILLLYCEWYKQLPSHIFSSAIGMNSFLVIVWWQWKGIGHIGPVLSYTTWDDLHQLVSVWSLKVDVSGNQ